MGKPTESQELAFRIYAQCCLVKKSGQYSINGFDNAKATELIASVVERYKQDVARLEAELLGEREALTCFCGAAMKTTCPMCDKWGVVEEAEKEE